MKNLDAAFPELDTVVMAAKAVVSFQTLISREESPFEPAVITVGSFHAGTRGNIIPEEAKVQLSLRSYTPQVRKSLIEGVTRIAKAEAAAARAPKDPVVKVTEGPQAVFNEPALTARLVDPLKTELGADNVVEMGRMMSAEDFSEYSKQGNFPSAMLWLGSVEPSKMKAYTMLGTPLPSMHSPQYAPDREKTLRTGVRTLTTIGLELLKK